LRQLRARKEGGSDVNSRFLWNCFCRPDYTVSYYDFYLKPMLQSITSAVLWSTILFPVYSSPVHGVSFKWQQNRA
jgi:hypothetical protein